MAEKKQAVSKARKTSSTERYMVPVVRSTFKILEELSRTGPLGLNEVTQRTRVSKSTVFRILTTLTRLGYVVRDEQREYGVSPALADLVGAESSLALLGRAALPHMLRLRDAYGETVNLGHLELDKVRYDEVVPSEFALRLHEQPGATVPAHASALGKVILAFSSVDFAEGILRGRELPNFTPNTVTDPEAILTELRRIRDRGFAFDRGEISPLATCVAAPILDSNGNAIAAISISGPTSRFNPKGNSAVVNSLLQSVADIGLQLHPRRAQAGS